MFFQKKYARRDWYKCDEMIQKRSRLESLVSSRLINRMKVNPAFDSETSPLKKNSVIINNLDWKFA